MLFQFRPWNPILIVLFVLVASQSLMAQQPPVQTRIQQPVISNFNISTVVSVPDGGLVPIGRFSTGGSSGIGYGVPLLGGSPWFGRPFRNRGLSSSYGGGSATVSVRIISNQEIEQDVLAEADHRESMREFSDPNGSKAIQAKADFLTRHMGGNRNR